MRYEGNERERWLTREEVNQLLKELPDHLSDIAACPLATGLRKANVLGLQWKQVDLVKRPAFVSASQSKTKRAIPVPLNEEAVAIIRRQIGKHFKFFFTYKDKPIKKYNTTAWRKALKRVGINDFRWHDLRHTWASCMYRIGLLYRRLVIFRHGKSLCSFEQ